MGLAHPVACKVQERYNNDQVRVGACSMQGFRATMEDAHSVKLDLGDRHQGIGYFGLFDGHGGSRASAHCSDVLHNMCQELPTFGSSEIKQLVHRLDEDFLSPENEFRGEGTTCLFALINFNIQQNPFSIKDGDRVLRSPLPSESDFPGYSIMISNTGDSRCVWGSTRSPSAFIQCTDDHKPTDFPERQRIERAGGFVVGGRVNGILALSRAIGDFSLKQNPSLHLFDQLVSPEPDVTSIVVHPGDWVLLACDGVFEVNTTEQIAACVSKGLIETEDPVLVARQVCDYALASGSKDNISSILLYFKDSKDWSVHKEKFFVHASYIPKEPTCLESYCSFAIDNGFEEELLDLVDSALPVPAAILARLSILKKKKAIEAAAAADQGERFPTSYLTWLPEGTATSVWELLLTDLE